MILLTGATGLVGGELLPMLLDSGQTVRALVREPRRLGDRRVDVQIAIGDLADIGDPRMTRQALRGVDTVIHLAGSVRDQPSGTIGEINGLATIQLLRAAEQAGVERFVFFSALNATPIQRTRFFRAKALAETAVRESPLQSTVFAPSIVYAPDDAWVRMQKRLSLLPVIPVSGSGDAGYQPIFAGDVARCVVAGLSQNGGGRHELAGPEQVTYEGIARLIARAAGRERPILHVPLPFVRRSLIWLRRLFGPSVFATWEEAELMEVPMVSERGDADVRGLGVEPKAMGEVLGVTQD